MQVIVYNVKMEKVGTVELPDAVFAAEVKNGLLWEQVKAQLASRRRGTHKTKKRGEVSGGGAKPHKQKGTGGARQGSIRAPNHVGGGTVFGPQPRDYSYRLPRSARRSALRSVLSLRAQKAEIIIVDDFSLSAPKTSDVAKFAALTGVKRILVLDDGNHNLRLSARNLPHVKYLEGSAVNVYDVLHCERLVVTKAALGGLVEKAKLAERGSEAASAA